MSLWLAVIWLVCAAICIAVFGFCRKRMADVGQQVAEEVENSVNKILKAERDAETRLLEAFTSFDNPAEAIRTYQKIMTEIFPCPQANPPWNWTREDIELWRKQTESKQRANRSWSTVLAALIIILALNIGAAVTTVIALNTIRPVLSTGQGLVNTGGAPTGQLPPPISVPPQLPPASGLPPLPTTGPPIPADDVLDKTQLPAPDVDNNLPNSSVPLDKNTPSSVMDDRISGGIDTPDKSRLFIKPNSDSDISDNDDTSSVSKDKYQDIEAIPDCNITEPSKSKGQDNE